MGWCCTRLQAVDCEGGGCSGRTAAVGRRWSAGDAGAGGGLWGLSPGASAQDWLPDSARARTAGWRPWDRRTPAGLSRSHGSALRA